MAAVDNNSVKAGSAPVRLAQKASAHARAPVAIRALAGGPIPSAALLPVPAQAQVPPRADALLHGAVPDPASGRHAQPGPQQSALAPVFCIPQSDREQKPWWKPPLPMRWPMSVPPRVLHPAKLFCHAPESANGLVDAPERCFAFSL